ncbi:MAG: hypothetical protein M0010_08140 [Actinomycetota bacterium]|nr:hypothetical protein [Actinomycetota bacterium]
MLDAIDEETALDAIYVLRTSEPDTVVSRDDLVETCESLAYLER